MKIIGISGKKQSGKNAVGAFIEQIAKEKGLRVRQIAFADALKSELSAALRTPVGFMEENKRIFRGGLQWYGTEYRRELYGESYWIDRLDDAIVSDPCRLTTLWIVTDVRFPNEHRYIRKHGGINLRIERPLHWSERLKFWRRGDSHDSETALDGFCFDWQIRNNSDLLTLNFKAHEFYAECVERMWRADEY